MNTNADFVIPLNEMNDILVSHGFRRLDLPYKSEYVYAKRMDKHDMPLSLRIYTGIPNDDTQQGSLNAIRFALFTKYMGKPYLVMGFSRVKRLANWRTLLIRTIEQAETTPLPICEQCQSVMLQKKMQPVCPNCQPS